MSEARGARQTVSVATAVATLMIAQQVAAKATRDTLFLSSFPATALPWVMGGSAILSIFIVLGFTRLSMRYSPAWVVPWVFALSSVLYVAEWWLAQTAPAAAAIMVYVHATALGATAVSGFWSVMNEHFDPHTAKSVISRITAGATFGGVIGGVVAWQAGRLAPLSTLLVILAALNFLCAIFLSRLRSRTRGSKSLPSLGVTSGIRLMRDVPYLRQLAILVVLATFAEICIDYVFKVRASEQFLDKQSLISFFAIFHAVVGVATFALQITLARASLLRVGLTGTASTLPVVNAIGAIVGAIIPGPWSVIGLRGTNMAVENSLYRSAYELLYTPLTPERKRPLKTIIDVGCNRLGSTLGSGVALFTVYIAPAAANTALLIVAAGLASLSIVITFALRRGYVDALADSLKQGSVKLELDAAVDATTRQTLVDTAMAIDRDKLLAEISRMRQSGEIPPPTDSVSPSRPLTQRPSADDMADGVATLRTGAYAEIEAVLAGHRELPATLIAPAIALLARDDAHPLAVRSLRTVAQRHVGQLIDALLFGETSFAVRRRLPRVLARCPNQRAVDGLVLALHDRRFEVRYRCAVALYHLVLGSEQLTVDPEKITAAALREAERSVEVWRGQRLLDEDSSIDSEVHQSLQSDELGRSLEYVFTLLSLILEPEPLELAFRALASGDSGLRGTGLEYLENVLPDEIRRALWKHLGEEGAQPHPAREREAVVNELLTSMSAMSINVADVRRAVAEASEDD